MNANYVSIATFVISMIAYVGQSFKIDELETQVTALTAKRVEVEAKEQEAIARKTELDCYPVHLKGFSKYGTPAAGSTFSCGDKEYSITSYEDEGADIFLGGLFPTTMTLNQMGCSIDGTIIRCRKEERVTSGRANGLLVYREFIAEVVVK